MENLTLKDRFLKVYSNLPVKVREEIIFVMDKKGPISWYVAYIEVNNNTELSHEILKTLGELNII